MFKTYNALITSATQRLEAGGGAQLAVLGLARVACMLLNN